MRPYTTDYANRQVDIEFMQTVVKPAESIPLQLSWQNGSTKIVTGMQKLVQRYTILLLTRVGDVQFDQEFGCTFWEDIMRGAAQNSGQIMAALAFVNQDIQAQLTKDDVDTPTFGTIPDDERLALAQLIDFTADTSTGTLYLQIQLTNVQGDSYTFILPTTVARS